MSDLDDAIERLNPDASPKHLYRGPSSTADVEGDLRLLIAVARERDARIRAEVIDWIAVTFNDYDVAYGVIDSAREHFGLTKGADRG